MESCPASGAWRLAKFFACCPRSLPLLALLVGMTGCQQEAPVPVQLEKVVRRDLTELVTATGKIQPVTQVKISPEVSGEIVELPVKEGDRVKKGDLLVKIRPELYEAALRQAEAGYQGALAGQEQARANLAKAEAEFRRNKELFEKNLVSASIYDEFRTLGEVARANVNAASHQVEQAAAVRKKAQEDLLRTTIFAPMDGTVAKLVSEKGERVVGTGMMAGTDIMTVADLAEMEARVEVGEVDVVLIRPGQKARLEVDSFKDRKFAGHVTQVARSAKTQGVGTQQESTKFEVRIRIEDKEPFLPGMSVTAEVETRYRTNVVAVPIQSVTTRLPKEAREAKERAEAEKKARDPKDPDFQLLEARRRETTKPREVVFVVENSQAKMVPVKRGISDDSHYEIVEGLAEGNTVVSGPSRALSRDLEDGKQVDTRTNAPSRFRLSFGGGQ